MPLILLFVAGSSCLVSCRSVIENKRDVSLECPYNDGDLQLVAKAWQGPATHEDYESAWSAAKSLAAASRTVALAGHGRAGVLCAGYGDKCSTNKYAITVASVNALPAPVEELAGKVTGLRLIGCWVGGGDAGADLVAAVARSSGAMVSAPACKVNSDGRHVWVPCGCKWQRSVRGERPAPIVVKPKTVKTYAVARLVFGVAMKSIAVSEITVLPLQVLTGVKPQEIPIRPSALLSRINLAAPRRTRTRLLATTVARVELDVEVERRDVRKKCLRILNWEYAQDEDDEDVFYDTDNRLEAVVLAAAKAMGGAR